MPLDLKSYIDPSDSREAQIAMENSLRVAGVRGMEVNGFIVGEAFAAALGFAPTPRIQALTDRLTLLIYPKIVGVIPFRGRPDELEN